MYYKALIFFFCLPILFSCQNNKTEVSTQIELIESPAPDGSMQPFLFNNDGKLLLSWTQKENDTLHGLFFSELQNNVWSPPVKISNGDNWFVNWADFPSVVANNSNYIAHYLQKSDTATFAYDVMIKQSKDYGKTWSDSFKLHSDSTKTEHGFVTILPYKESFVATWLDGRNTVGLNTDHNHGDGHGAMTLRAAIISEEGVINDEELLDNKTCDCCQTTATITEEGPIIFYRNRTDNEVRDIYFARFDNEKWSEPKPIYNDDWEINGCPVNGPKCDYKDKTLSIAWFTAANKNPKVKVAFSFDNGKNFEKPIELDIEKPLGRVDIAMIDGKSALVSWIATEGNNTFLKVCKVYSNGKIVNTFIVSNIENSRASGFPQMEIVNDNVYFAWNFVENDLKKIKMAKILLNTLK